MLFTVKHGKFVLTMIFIKILIILKKEASNNIVYACIGFQESAVMLVIILNMKSF